MPVESFRGYVAAIIAAILLVGGIAAAIFAWMNSTEYLPDGTTQERDLAIVFGLIGSLTGAAATFLFLTDASARASHASERSFKEGRKPQGPPDTGEFTATTTTETTSSTADDAPAVYTEADAARHMEDDGR